MATSGPGTEEKYGITGENFERMLAFLNRLREPPGLTRESILRSRGERYEEVRRNLIRRFRSWGCREPETLADETFNRIAARLPESYGAGDEPEKYVQRVAYFVSLESFRRQKPPPLPVPPQGASETDEAALDCLERCLEKLASGSREIILDYYRNEHSSRIGEHRRLAERLGMGLNALRIRACRIRSVVQGCVMECLDGRQDEPR